LYIFLTNFLIFSLFFVPAISHQFCSIQFHLYRFFSTFNESTF